MQASNLPTKVPLPFANAGAKNTIPLASQIGITPGAASLTDGFPPDTRTPLVSGGIPPSGADMNGILNLITGVQQWQSAGGIFKYDSAFSTSVDGYPKGAILESSDGSTLWLCLADNNTTDPDGATPANWAPAASYGIAAITGLTNANVTLTPAQYSKPIITLAGTLTGNVQIILPTILDEWLFINNTTGSFAITAKTPSGIGVAIPQGFAQKVFGDGTNIVVGSINKAYADSLYAPAPTTGTWTGTLAAGTSGTITMVNVTGRWTKNNKLVTISGTFDVLSVSSPVGTLKLTGLPFPCASGGQYDTGVALRVNNVNSSGFVWQAMIMNNSSQINIEVLNQSTGAIGTNTAALLGANSSFSINAQYVTP